MQNVENCLAIYLEKLSKIFKILVSMPFRYLKTKFKKFKKLTIWFLKNLTFLPSLVRHFIILPHN